MAPLPTRRSSIFPPVAYTSSSIHQQGVVRGTQGASGKRWCTVCNCRVGGGGVQACGLPLTTHMAFVWPCEILLNKNNTLLSSQPLFSPDTYHGRDAVDRHIRLIFGSQANVANVQIGGNYKLAPDRIVLGASWVLREEPGVGISSKLLAAAFARGLKICTTYHKTRQ